jgi:tRNA A-37 threonylcarbamoyl transferase component Bud32
METSARLLGGRYELGSLLASGGMGRVWRARDTVLNRAVAVKILRSEYTDDAAFLARFRAEAQHAAALHHPNIASVFDYGEVEDGGERLAYLVMELVEGESLATLLARSRRLDVATALRVMRGTAAALAVAHSAGLVHRDVKPGNVLVAHDGVVKITDFGIAWSASSVPLTRTGQVIGTAHYLSPEQAQGGRAAPASDVYALGAVIYECLAGRRPFDGENSVQIVVKHIREHPEPLPADVPADVRALVEQAMAKDPARRFPDGDALLAAVDDVLAGSRSAASGAGPTGTAVMQLPVLPADVHPRGPQGRRAPRADDQHVAAPPVERRRPTAVLIGAVVTLLLIAAIVTGLSLLGDDGSGTPEAAPSTTTAEQTTAQQTPAVVRLDPAAYLGRPVTEVQAELEALDLVVALQAAPTADVAEGLVTALGPTDGLVAGTTVTVSYAVAPPAAPDEGEDDAGEGNGNADDGGGADDDKDKKGKGRGRGNGD